MTDKAITEKSALEIIKKNAGTTVSSLVLVLVAVNPTWAVLFVLAQGLINAWGDFGLSRVNELVDDLVAHKNEFDPEVLKTNKFKSIFLNVVERQMKEVYEEKRKLFRNYLRNFGKKPDNNYNYHTKALIVLDQITSDELMVIDIWSGKLQQALISKNPGSYSQENIEEKMLESGQNEHQIMFAFENEKDAPSLDELVFLLRSLGNYGLLNTVENTGSIVGSGSDGIRVKNITSFGKHFLEFIKE